MRSILQCYCYVSSLSQSAVVSSILYETNSKAVGKTDVLFHFGLCEKPKSVWSYLHLFYFT